VFWNPEIAFKQNVAVVEDRSWRIHGEAWRACQKSEARLAVSVLGLDPGIGFLPVDTPNRDSLAFDLMEAVRPAIDAWLLDWVMREPFRRSWFFETATGNCRLMGPFAAKLSETVPAWGRLVAPYAERIATLLWSGRQSSGSGPAARLTQRRKREARGRPSFPVSCTCTPASEHLPPLRHVNSCWTELLFALFCHLGYGTNA
jgi:hypothetical protein